MIVKCGSCGYLFYVYSQYGATKINRCPSCDWQWQPAPTFWELVRAWLKRTLCVSKDGGK